MVFNRYLPHISGKVMSEMRVLSILFIRNVKINKKKQIIKKNMKLFFTPLISMHGGYAPNKKGKRDALSHLG